MALKRPEVPAIPAAERTPLVVSLLAVIARQQEQLAQQQEQLAQQQEQLQPVIDALTSTPAETAVDVWRQESARAAQRFLERISSDIVSTP